MFKLPTVPVNRSTGIVCKKIGLLQSYLVVKKYVIFVRYVQCNECVMSNFIFSQRKMVCFQSLLVKGEGRITQHYSMLPSDFSLSKTCLQDSNTTGQPLLHFQYFYYSKHISDCPNHHITTDTV